MQSENNYCTHCAEYVTPFPNGACSGCFEKSGMQVGPAPRVEAKHEADDYGTDGNPYAPQDTQGHGDPNYLPLGSSTSKLGGDSSNDFEYRDISGLTLILTGLLVLGAIADAGLTGTNLQHVSRLKNGISGGFGDTPYTLSHLIATTTAGFIFLLTLPFFGRWIILANRNVRALGARNLEHSPGRALGVFFIPILNLFRPYQAMRDLERASHDPRVWQTSRQGSFAALWWALWLITPLISGISVIATADALRVGATIRSQFGRALVVPGKARGRRIVALFEGCGTQPGAARAVQTGKLLLRRPLAPLDKSK